jgi:hypothetical protein
VNKVQSKLVEKSVMSIDGKKTPSLSEKTMPEFLRPILARLVGAAVAALCIWLARKFQVQIDADSQVQLTGAGLAVLWFIGNVAYSLVHKGVNSKINPMDAATNELADKGKSDQRVLKASR